jgi:hypothetical protein
MDAPFLALASAIPVAAAVFVWTYRWLERARARREVPITGSGGPSARRR